jgi:hypothetical protein
VAVPLAVEALLMDTVVEDMVALFRRAVVVFPVEGALLAERLAVLEVVYPLVVVVDFLPIAHPVVDLRAVIRLLQQQQQPFPVNLHDRAMNRIIST